MKVENLRKAADLAREIERRGWTLSAYRKAGSIVVHMKDGGSTGREDYAHATLTAAEIGDAVVEALQRRLAKMRAELTALGVTVDAAGDAGRP